MSGVVVFLAGCGAMGAELRPATQQDVTVAVQGDFQDSSAPDTADVALAPSTGVFEGLVRTGHGFRVEPLLATSWGFKAPRTWRFHLRRGVRFHNGAALTAEAVTWTVQRWIRSGDANYLALGPGATVSAVDNETVDIQTSVPNRRLVEQLAAQNRGILAPGTFPGNGGSPVSTPVGTGPFHFVAYYPGQALVLARWAGYWDHPARLQRLTFRYYPDSQSISAAAGQQAVDIAVGLDPAGALEARSSAPYRLALSESASRDMLLFNSLRLEQHPLVGEVAVRRAVAMALNSPEIVTQGWEGLATPAGGLVESSLRPPGAGTAPRFNPAAARSLLDSAGWHVAPDGIRARDGQRLQLKVTLGDMSERVKTGAIILENLRAVGVDAVMSLPAVDDFFNHSLGQANYDIVGIGFIGQRDANPLGVVSYFSTDPGGCSLCIFANLGGAFDAEYARALGADEITARRQASGLERTVLTDQAVAIVLVSKPVMVAVRRDLQDFVAQPRDQRFATVWRATAG